LPALRRAVRSLLPPPWAKRDPFTKSAPWQRAATKRGISCGSVEPSASSITMMSPVEASKPLCKGVTLARALLFDDLGVGPQLAGDLARAVRRASVDDDHLVQIAGQASEHVGQVLDLVEGRDDHAHAGTL